MLARVLALALSASPSPADREEAATDPAPDTTPAPTRPPKPDRAHGIARPHRKGARSLLWIPRSVLYLPRRTLDLALSPARVALWAFERYDLDRRFFRIFYFVPPTFGIFPSARFESSFGGSVGIRLIHRNLFGRGGSLGILGSFGGVFGQRFRLDGSSRSFARGRARLGVSTEYRVMPADRFYGIGNSDIMPAPPFGTRIDPRSRDDAVSTRFEHEFWRFGVLLGVRIRPEILGMVSSTFTWRRFGPSTRTNDDTNVADVYAMDGLVAYQTDVTNVYNQVRFELDTRKRSRTRAMPAAGWLGAVYGGHAIGLGDDPSNFGRLGLDVQRFVDLWRGTRLLRLRGVVESAIAPLDRIPFVELPMLGGPYFLRGYPRGRFRDRVVIFGTVEYVWEIDDFIAGFLFVEPGRVWSGTLPAEPSPVRMGYGGGFQFHTRRMFLARIQLASTIDGGFSIVFNFAPATRWRDGR